MSEARNSVTAPMTVPRAAPKHVITIDFETYYSSTFSLSKLTTEEYVRSPEFETIGVSVKLDDGPTEWCTGDALEIYTFLQRYPWDDAMAVAHNAMFDMAILNWRFGIKPRAIADTLSMARALHGLDGSLSLSSLAARYGLGYKGDAVIHALGKRREDFGESELASYGAYCCNDTELTYALFLRLAEDFPRLEMRLIDLTIRMFTEPRLRLDAGVLVPHLEGVKAKKEALLAETRATRGELMSNHKLAEVLSAMGVEVPMKISPATGKETFAFAKGDTDFTDLLEHPDLRVQTLVAARLGVKSTLEETRTERFIGMAGRGALPVPLAYYAAHTGRWGGSQKLNLQNIPRDSPLKKAILAPDGHVIIDCDSSQIEARTLAWLAEQDDLVEAFDAGEDVYKIMASSIYKKPVDEVDKNERFVGKTVVLGAGYGISWAKFQLYMKVRGVTVDDAEAQYIVRTYRETYPRIPLLWKQAGKALEAVMAGRTAPFGREGVLEVEGKDGIRLPNGLYLRYPDLHWEQSGDNREMVYTQKKGRASIRKRIYGAAAVENVCQALARIVVGEQLLMVSKRYPVALTVHDSLGVVAPIEEQEAATDYVMSCMRIRPKWAPLLPLNCEAKSGVSYGG